MRVAGGGGVEGGEFALRGFGRGGAGADLDEGFAAVGEAGEEVHFVAVGSLDPCDGGAAAFEFDVVSRAWPVLGLPLRS